MKFKSFENASDQYISEWMEDKIIVSTNTTVGQMLIYEGYPEHGSATIIIHTFIYEEE